MGEIFYHIVHVEAKINPPFNICGYFEVGLRNSNLFILGIIHRLSESS